MTVALRRPVGGRRRADLTRTGPRVVNRPVDAPSGAAHPRTIGWLDTAALAMGGSNQSLFLLAALVASQGSAAIPLLGVGLLLSFAAAPGWTELVLMWPDRVGGIASTCAEAFRRYNPVLSNLTGVCYWWGWVPTCGLTALLSADALHAWYLPAVPTAPLAVAIVVAFAILNLTGISRVTRVVRLIAIGSGTLAFLSAIVPIWSGSVDAHQAMHWNLTAPFDGVFGKVSGAMAGLYLIGFAAPAFEAATCHVGEMRDPDRTLPRAMFFSAGMAALYFVVLPVVWLGVFGAHGIAGADSTGLAHLLGPTFAPLVGSTAKSFAVWFMVLNMFHGTVQPLAGASRTISQLSDDGLLPRLVGRRNRADAPHVAIVLTAGAAVVFLLAGDPVWMIAAANFTYLIGIALPSVAVWLLRRDHPEWVRPWRAPRGTVTLGLLAAAAWLVSTLLGFRQFRLPVVIFGLLLAYSGCIFFAWRRFTDRRAAGRPPIPRSLHLKLTGAMLTVMVLDGSGYLLAVSSAGGRSPVMVAVLEDLFVAVAIVTITVGLVLPGMIAHSVTEVAAAAKRLSTETLMQLTTAMDALGRGNLDEARVSPNVTPVEVISRDEVGAMAVAFNGMQRSVAEAAHALDSARLALRKSRGDLEYLATHDSLTELPNRRHIEMEVERIVDDCAALGRDCTVVAIDLDGFKFINDSRGHAAGDGVLRGVAALFRQHLRASDFIGRLGGDEFAAVLPDTSPDDAQTVMVTLLAALRAAPVALDDGTTVRITASAGLASLRQDPPPSAPELLIQADVAMYQAKDTGRDRIALYSTLDPQQADVMLRHTWVERILDALGNDKFVLLVQPLMNLATNEIDHYEALLRMVDDDGSLIAPGQFLPAAERSGLIKRIDRWVIGAACQLLATEQDAGRRIHLAVNLSGTSMSDPSIGEVIESAVAGLPRPDGMIIEVTETAAITDIPRARAFATRMADIGCQFALDDFGAGYGSFYYLRHLPFDYLKIDGSFVGGMLTDRADEVLVRSLVQVARELGKRTVAEFVEDAATLAKLKELGVDYAQGYYVGRPGPMPNRRRPQADRDHRPTLTPRTHGLRSPVSLTDRGAR